MLSARRVLLLSGASLHHKPTGLPNASAAPRTGNVVPEHVARQSERCRALAEALSLGAAARLAGNHWHVNGDARLPELNLLQCSTFFTTRAAK